MKRVVGSAAWPIKLAARHLSRHEAGVAVAMWALAHHICAVDLLEIHHALTKRQGLVDKHPLSERSPSAPSSSERDELV
jgi:hypothetical protein